MKIFQKGFNFSQDGPGNRLVYHLAGCNLRCRWCSNPECFGDKESFKEITVEDIVNEAVSCKMMFFDGGGVTFTGGEATLDADFLIKALLALKEKGIHTAIETNATSAKLSEIVKYTDYLIMDFKHYDNAKFKEYTGAENDIIKENFAMISSLGRQCLVRIPLINEFNGKEAKAFADFFAGMNCENFLFEFLKYHEYGKAKWGGEYKITDGFVTEEQRLDFEREFASRGLKCVRT